MVGWAAKCGWYAFENMRVDARNRRELLRQRERRINFGGLRFGEEHQIQIQTRVDARSGRFACACGGHGKRRSRSGQTSGATAHKLADVHPDERWGRSADVPD